MKFLGQSNTSWDRKVITVLCTDNYPKAMLNFFLHFTVCIALSTSWASLVAQMVKNPPAVQETWVPSLDQEDPLEKGMATHSSTLAWRIPWAEDPGRLQSMGLQRVRHDWATELNRTAHIYRQPREEGERRCQATSQLPKMPWRRLGSNRHKCNLFLL